MVLPTGRRGFIEWALSVWLSGRFSERPTSREVEAVRFTHEMHPDLPTVTLFLCGDLMTGRGIDQILAHPSEPRLYEPYVRSALEYVRLAEIANGPIDRPVDVTYIWGDALNELARQRPDVRIVNLETAITSSETRWPDKGIHYRMHPANVACLTAGSIDCCVLANNHVLDWGRSGLVDTLETLDTAGIRAAGAGRNDAEANQPAVMDVRNRGRVLVFAYCTESSGVPPGWAAATGVAGVSLLRDLSDKSVTFIAEQVRAAKAPLDIAVASIHWGGNWGFRISPQERAFAHRLIEAAGFDLVHGHSSHHVKGIEVYRGKLILYGCGDLLNDYEGIGGYSDYRPDLSLMYFPRLEMKSGRLVHLTLVPTQVRQLRINRAQDSGIRWLATTLSREGEGLGTRIEREGDGSLSLQWD